MCQEAGCNNPVAFHRDAETGERVADRFCPECTKRRHEIRQSRASNNKSDRTVPCRNTKCDNVKADDNRPYCYPCHMIQTGQWVCPEDCDSPDQWDAATKACDKCGYQGATLKRYAGQGGENVGAFNKLCSECFGARPRCPGGPATQGCGAFLEVDEKTGEAKHAHCFDCYKDEDNCGACKVLTDKGKPCGNKTTLSNKNAGVIMESCQSCFKSGAKCRTAGCFARTEINTKNGQHFWYCKKHYQKPDGKVSAKSSDKFDKGFKNAPRAAAKAFARKPIRK
jgi:hypothetical protein